MGVNLRDKETRDFFFGINFWNWRTIVEQIRSLDILPDERVDDLHESFCGFGLSREECLLVADKLESRIISQLSDTERVLLSGEKTEKPDDYKFHKNNIASNYSTNKEALEEFVTGIRQCNGFEVC